MTDSSANANEERIVQHGSSTWLEQPTIASLPIDTNAAATLTSADGYVAVSSMRLFRPLDSARLDPSQTSCAMLASSGSRFAPLQDSEEGNKTQENQDTVTK